MSDRDKRALRANECPHPQDDHDGYLRWCEAHACPRCNGTGEIECDDDEDEVVCRYCQGSGVDPMAVDDLPEGML